MKSLNCPNPDCTPPKELTARAIIRYGGASAIDCW
jgi:hypothetical protein